MTSAYITYPKVMTCPIEDCDFNDTRLKRVARIITHLKTNHNLSEQEAFVAYHKIVEIPKCECGCDQKVIWRDWHYGFPRFVRGHNGAASGDEHWTRSKHNSEKLDSSRRKASISRSKNRENNKHISSQRSLQKFINGSFIRFGIERFNLENCYNTFENYSSRISITCLTCTKQFITTPQIHLNTKSGGCRNCYKAAVMNKTDDLIKRIQDVHSNKITWNKPRQVWIHEIVEFECNVCGLLYRKSLNNTLSKRQGCPKCRSARSSKKERDWLNSIGIDKCYWQKRITTHEGNSYWVDALVDNVVYEYYGSWWHGDPRLPQREAIFDVTGYTADHLYKKTIDRENEIVRSGFEVRSVWELDLANSNNRSANING